MKWDQYQVSAQRSAGRDGIVYEATALKDETPVLIYALHRARADAARWQRLKKRLHLAAMLQLPAAGQILELNLDEEPPSAVVAADEGPPLARALQHRLPLELPEGLEHAVALAGLLAAAHRLGLVLGRLRPSTITVTSEGGLKVDCTGLELAPPEEEGAEATLDASCRPPEVDGDDVTDSAADVYSVGALLHWMRTGRPAEPTIRAGVEDVADGEPERTIQVPEGDVSEPLMQLIEQMLAADPDERPSAQVVLGRLTQLVAPPAEQGPRFAATQADPVLAFYRRTEDQPAPTGQLGRFRLGAKLGEGGMGAVYRGEDPADSTVVAVKVLRSGMQMSEQALRRFHKEARLLAQINNPFIANLIEFNEDAGVHFLVTEFVDGLSLRQHIDQHGRLTEPQALAYLADICRGLREAHERGIVHRDVKPENVILTETAGVARAKLLDFGLARQMQQSESMELTQAGFPMGTPLYMAPEQWTGTGGVSPRTDVYALGATLFYLLAGRPPFQGVDTVGTMLLHCSEPVPALRQFNPSVNDGVEHLVKKAMAKDPADRYADAAAMLEDLERLRRGEPTTIAAHPRLPACDPRKVVRCAWTWELTAPPEALWPHVSNTERLNRAIGLPAVEYSTEANPQGGARRFGMFRKAGVVARWQEHPFEWIEGRRMGVLREYSSGVLKWLLSTVEMTPLPGGGTSLTHRVDYEPANLLGRVIGAIEIDFKAGRAFKQIYHRIDAALKARDRGGDPFEPAAKLSRRRRRQLDAALQQLRREGVAEAIVEKLGDFLEEAPDQEVSRIRPRALAERLQLDPEAFVDACLLAAQTGLLVLLWDILCPVCRIPTQIKDTLRELKQHDHCEACNLDFQLDFANSVEMIFRVHPSIRASELRTYCIGGPAHSGHVVTQTRLAPGERLELGLELPEGAYRFRGPQLPFTIDFRVHPNARAEGWDLNLRAGPDPELPRTLRTGTQRLALTNDSDHEIVARVERTAPRQDAVTAARASGMPSFRRLFPGEILAPGQLVSVAAVTLLATRLENPQRLYQTLGEAQAFGLIHEHFVRLAEHVRSEGGSLIKTMDEGALLAFDDTPAAVRVALGLNDLLAKSEDTRALRLGVGVHRGHAMVATLNDHLDYFGTAVKQTFELAQLARGGDVLLSPEVAGEPQVAALLRKRRLRGEPLSVRGPGQTGPPVLRLTTGEPVADALPAPGSNGAAPAKPAERSGASVFGLFYQQVARNPVFDRPEMQEVRRQLFETLAEFCRSGSVPLPLDPDEQARLTADLMRVAAAAPRLASPAHAVSFYRQAVTVLERLVREQPKRADYRKSLARCHNNLAVLFRGAGALADARAALGQALALYQQLQAEQLRPGRFAFEIGAVCYNMGILVGQQNEGDAPGWYARAVQSLKGVGPADPSFASARVFLRHAEQHSSAAAAAPQPTPAG